MTPNPPAMIDGLSFDDYRAIDAASSHALATILDKSPRHLKESERKPSAAMSLGTLVHSLILTPDLDDYAVAPDGDRRTKAGKQAFEEFQVASEGRLLVTQDQFDTAARMRDAVLGHSIGRVLFAKGKAEQTLLAIDPESGLLCKGRLDWLPTDLDLLVDLKTCQSAAPAEIARDAGKYRYHQQAAFYSHLWTLVAGERLPFMFACVESAPPFDVAVYELDADALEAGERRFRAALTIWAECLESGVWPGYLWDRDTGAHRIETLSIPRWAL
ncbi:PD-(D/E)XK nuclease-like domain-containing protein [uncultured Thiocystis sp.]|uniref:PD-(D/E)XK nuclease-like domain-containing protein n=1 Tax=uncultured Thiocystis sp. TaxID=1202134 RepID=UPI0025D51FC8|nr:PD-(D/E)XK nuclease-like domain-containing protein [uncultured Thiocystis sp.]